MNKRVYTLLDRGRVTAQELADKLNVSKRTILRDIETLALDTAVRAVED